MTTINAHLATLLTLLGIVIVPWLIGKATNIFIGDQDETHVETWGFGIWITCLAVAVILFLYFTYTLVYTCYTNNYNN